VLLGLAQGGCTEELSVTLCVVSIKEEAA